MFGVPALAGYPVWSGDFGSIPLITLPQTIDTTTFATLNRPVRAWLRTALSRGELPLWLETQALGVPLIEQYEYNLLYPLEWVKWLVEDGWWTTVLCFELAVAGFGLYLAARQMLGVSALSALAGAVVSARRASRRSSPGGTRPTARLGCSRTPAGCTRTSTPRSASSRSRIGTR